MTSDIFALMASPELGIFLAAVTPSIAFTSINTPFFTNKQIRNAIVLMAVFGVVLALAFHLLAQTSFLLSPLWARLLAGTLIVILLLILNERLLTELLPEPRRRRAVLTTGMAFLLGLASFSFLPLNLLLLGYLALSAYDLFTHFHDGKSPVYSDVHWKKKSRPMGKKPTIAFSSKPNVYLFYLESVHSEKALQTLYGSSAGKDTRAFLESFGYTIYPEANSNMDWTIISRISVLECRIPWTYSDRNIVHNAFVLRIFKENGYTINLFDVDNSPYVLGDYTEEADFCSFTLPRHIMFLFRFCAPLFAQTRWLRWLVGGRDPGATEEKGTAEYFNSLEKHILAAPDQRPRFSVIRFGAPHTVFYRSTWGVVNWEEEYVAGYVNAMERLKNLAALIHDHDPDAAVLVIGDHGAHSLDKAWIAGDSPNDGLRAHKIDPHLLYLDLFSVLTAVKWPKGGAPEGFDAIHVNLFIWLFIALSGDESLRRFLHPNICLLSHKFRTLHLVAENRLPLAEPVPCSHNPAMLKYQTASVDELYAYDAAYHTLALENLRQMEQTPEVTEKIRRHLDILRSTASGLDLLRMKIDMVRDPSLAAQAAPLYAELFTRSGEKKAWSGWFTALKNQNDMDGALACLEKGKQANLFKNEEVQHQLAHLYYEFHKWKEAEALCAPLALRFPLEYRYAKLLYRILYARGNDAQALEALQRFQRFLADSREPFPREADLLKNIGLMAMKTGNWPLAETTFAALRPQRSTTCWLIMLEAYALNKSGQIRKAVQLVLQELQKITAQPLIEFLGLIAVKHRLKGKDFDEIRALALPALLTRKQRLASSGLFDSDWYRTQAVQNRSKQHSLQPLDHYLQEGVFEGKTPNPCFDPFFYLSIYDDIFESGSNPLEHYMGSGAAFYRWPSPHFSTIRYVIAHPHLKETGENPLVHYLRNRQPTE